MYLRTYSTRQTPQGEAIPGSTQVQNSAGGYAWAVDDWMRLDRFLILGSEGGSYYANERALTRENADAVLRCIKTDGRRVVERIVEVSEAGRAPKNDPALFALAMCAGLGDAATKRAAFQVLPRVARIGTHLFHFVSFVEQFRGWGRGLRDGVAGWYGGQGAGRLEYQVVKYQQRDGWSHRDLLRLSHPKASDEVHNTIYHWATQGWDGVGGEPHPQVPLIWAFERAKRSTDTDEIVKLIRDYNLPRECIPTQFLNDPKVWEALLESMPMTAMIRNLGKMSQVGLLGPMSAASATVVERLRDEERIRKARVHPIGVLAALKTYAEGCGVRGGNTWLAVPQVVDALNDAFYLAFGNVQSTGKRWMLALDVSGSMAWGTIAGVPGLTPRVGSAAMALVTANTEPQYITMGFSDKLVPLGISPRQRLDDVLRIVDQTEMEGTDCALPMVWALQNKVPVDVFVVYTDGETWYGDIHPAQALREYRQRMGIPAKLIVVGMVANNFSIADPNDGGMLDVVGFDTATPQVMSDFVGW